MKIVYYGMPFISEIASFLEVSKYFLLFLGSFFEGPAAMMAGGLLWHLGHVQFWPMYAILVAADFTADMMWYAVGYFAGRPFMKRWGHLINFTPQVFEKVEQRFHRHQTTILILSKLTAGLGFAIATLVTAGMLRVSIVRYVTIQLLGGIVWVGCMIAVGYNFGNVLASVPRDLQIALSVVAIVGFFFFLRFVGKRLSQLDW